MTTTTNAGDEPKPGRGHLLGRVFLWIGIAVLPLVFAWVTLLKSFSVRSRFIAFGWMGLQLLASVFGHFAPSTTSASKAPVTATATGGGSSAMQASQPSKQTFTESIPPPLTPTQVHARDVAEAKIFWKAVVEQTDACDKIAPFISRAAERSNIYNLYDNAEIAKRNCFATAENVKQIIIPEHASDSVKSGLRDALSSTSEAYSTKAVTYSKMADMANGGVTSMRPSDLADLKQMSELGQLAEFQAVAKTADAFSKENVDIEDYSGAGEKGKLGRRQKRAGG